MRAFDWDPIRAEHYGQRLHRRTKQAGHMTAPDQCCIMSKKLLSIRRRPHMTQRWGNRPAKLTDSGKLGCCASGCMVKRGPHLRPQASEGEAQHGLFCWTGCV